MSEYLTIREVSSRLRCCDETIRRAIKRGEITAFFHAGRYLIAEEDVPRRMPVAPPGPRAVRIGKRGEFAQIAREVTGLRAAS